MGVPSVSFCGQDANDSRPAQTNKLAAARPLRLVAVTSLPPRHWHANTAGVTQKQVELFCGELVAVARQALRLGGRAVDRTRQKKRQVLPFVKSPKWAGWWLVACQARPRSTGLKEGARRFSSFSSFCPPTHGPSHPIFPSPSPPHPSPIPHSSDYRVPFCCGRRLILASPPPPSATLLRALHSALCTRAAFESGSVGTAPPLSWLNCRLVDSLLSPLGASAFSNFSTTTSSSSPNRALGRARCRAPHAIAGRPPFTQRRGPQHQTAAKRHLIAVASNNPSIRRTPHTARPTTVQSSPPWLLRRCPLRLCACPHTASQTHTLCRACALARHTCLSPIARDGHSHGRCRCRCRAPGSPVARHRQPPGLCASHRQSAADLAHHENALFFAQFSPTRSELPGGR